MSDDTQHFAIQRAISTAAQQLNTTQFAEFKRLSKKLVYGPDFQLLLLDCRDELRDVEIFQRGTKDKWEQPG